MSKELVTAEGDRKKALEAVLAQHEKNQKTNEEALEQLNAIIPEVKNLLTA